MAAVDSRSLLPKMVGEDSVGTGAAEGQADISPTDQQAGGTLEGEP